MNIKKTRGAERCAHFATDKLHIGKESALAQHADNGRVPDAHTFSKKFANRSSSCRTARHSNKSVYKV